MNNSATRFTRHLIATRHAMFLRNSHLHTGGHATSVVANLHSPRLFRLAEWNIFLYFGISATTLASIGWHYLGGGLEIEKVHPATYLLVLTFSSLFTFGREFKKSAKRQFYDLSFFTFIATSFAAALYAILIKGTSVTPFVDTFLSAILITFIVIAMPIANLRHFRTLLDVGIAINVALMLTGFITKQASILDLPTGAYPDSSGQIRWSGMLGLPLSAAQVLCAYALIVSISALKQISPANLARFGLALAALAAGTLTGGRSAVSVAAIMAALFASFSIMSQILRSRIRRSTPILVGTGIILALVAIPIASQLGLFDVILSRFEYDNGSGYARELAIKILTSTPPGDLFLGISREAVIAQQQSYGLELAIEISWINFILICGIIFTVPLFCGFCLFLFQYLRKHCITPVVLFGLYTIILTFSYNSIWSKTTALAITVAIAVANLRKDIAADTALKRSAQSKTWVTSHRTGNSRPRI